MWSTVVVMWCVAVDMWPSCGHIHIWDMWLYDHVKVIVTKGDSDLWRACDTHIWSHDEHMTCSYGELRVMCPLVGRVLWLSRYVVTPCSSAVEPADIHSTCVLQRTQLSRLGRGIQVRQGVPVSWVGRKGEEHACVTLYSFKHAIPTCNRPYSYKDFLKNRKVK